jgi:hypothetical protein
MDEPSNTPARLSALEGEAATLFQLLAATAEAMGTFSSHVGAVLHERDDSRLGELREELFSVNPRVIALAGQLRVLWPEATSFDSLYSDAD